MPAHANSTFRTDDDEFLYTSTNDSNLEVFIQDIDDKIHELEDMCDVYVEGRSSHVSSNASTTTMLKTPKKTTNQKHHSTIWNIMTM